LSKPARAIAKAGGSNYESLLPIADGGSIMLHTFRTVWPALLPALLISVMPMLTGLSI
jgi:hypothetical protein